MLVEFMFTLWAYLTYIFHQLHYDYAPSLLIRQELL